jgi:hypothetical protein
MKMNEDARGKLLLRAPARNSIGFVLCLILSVGWVRALLTTFGWLMIALLFNDSGASFGKLVAVSVPKFGGPALIFLALTSIIVIFAWLKGWVIIAIIAVVPVAILDISPAGTFNRAIDAIYFARDSLR